MDGSMIVHNESSNVYFDNLSTKAYDIETFLVRNELQSWYSFRRATPDEECWICPCQALDRDSLLNNKFLSGNSIYSLIQQVRRLGNIQRYTVQCIVDPKIGDTRPIAAQANTAVCFTIASLLIVHLLYTLVVAPPVNGFGRKNGFISDVNLAMTVGVL